VRADPGSPGAAVTRVTSSHPLDSRPAGRAGAGPVELRLVGLRLDRRGLGIPLAFTVTPPGETESLCRIRDSRPRVLRRARRSRLASVSSASSSYQAGSRIAPFPRPCRAAPRVTPLHVSSGLPADVLLRVAKDRPSTVSGVEETASRVDVAACASEIGCRPISRAALWFCTTLAALLCSARVLHRASRHGVRDVSSPRQRIPTTRSHPPKPCSA
jgi:hypothetical protein